MKTKQRVEAAWEDYTLASGSPHSDGSVTYEHNQYWVICKCGASWSVNDGNVDGDGGFGFEEIASGDDDYHLPTPPQITTIKTIETAEIIRLTQELEIIRLKRAIAIEGPTIKGLLAATNLPELFAVIPIRKVITGLFVLLMYSWFFGFPLF